MRYKKVLLVTLLIAGLYSCQKEFDPAGDWRESYAVYCLLNLKDSVQYVRINRVFLTGGDPAQYYQVPDSVNVDPETLEVSLIRLKDGIPEGDPVYFLPTDEFPKEEGLFTGEKYIVFKSSALLGKDRSYRLIIRNSETGFRMQSETGLLGNRTLEYSFIETRFYNINQYHAEVVDYDGSLITSQFEKRVIRLLYYEYRGDEVKKRYLDWRSSYTKEGDGCRTDTAQLSDELMKYFGENIPVDPDVKRKAVGVDKMLIINDETVSLYISHFNFTSSGEYVPEFTTFDHGTGIFASRYNYTFFAMKLKPETLDSLAYGRFTRHLGFSDASGNWPP